MLMCKVAFVKLDMAIMYLGLRGYEGDTKLIQHMSLFCRVYCELLQQSVSYMYNEQDEVQENLEKSYAVLERSTF